MSFYDHFLCLFSLSLFLVHVVTPSSPHLCLHTSSPSRTLSVGDVLPNVLPLLLLSILLFVLKSCIWAQYPHIPIDSEIFCIRFFLEVYLGAMHECNSKYVIYSNVPRCSSRRSLLSLAVYVRLTMLKASKYRSMHLERQVSSELERDVPGFVTHLK